MRHVTQCVAVCRSQLVYTQNEETLVEVGSQAEREIEREIERENEKKKREKSAYEESSYAYKRVISRI